MAYRACISVTSFAPSWHANDYWCAAPPGVSRTRNPGIAEAVCFLIAHLVLELTNSETCRVWRPNFFFFFNGTSRIAASFSTRLPGCFRVLPGTHYPVLLCSSSLAQWLCNHAPKTLCFGEPNVYVADCKLDLILLLRNNGILKTIRRDCIK